MKKPANQPLTSASKTTSNFGTSVSQWLIEAKATQVDLSNSAGISQPYLNQMMTGRKKPSPEWVDIIASTLKLSKEKTQELHLAAARDHGFKL